MQDVPQHLHPYWCFRDDLTILDGLIMKGNRVIIPTSMRHDTLELSRLHDAHQGITSTLRRARRTVYWPKLQDDITEMVQKCDDCQRHGNKKSRIPERQIEFQGRYALVTVDYFSGFLTYDTLKVQTSEAVIKVLNSNFRKFGLPEKILSDNGPCFRSESFRRFCEQLDIGHITSSPYHHQSNGRAERAVGIVEHILKKSRSDVAITKALTTYLDTPVSDTLPSPAELFFNRRINTRLSMNMTPVPLTDQQKTGLNDKRSAHLKSTKQDQVKYMLNQPVWFTDDALDEWKPGYIDSKDSTPNAYWIINDASNRRLRRNTHDIKPRHTFIAHQRPQQTVFDSHPECHVDRESPPPAVVEQPSGWSEIPDSPPEIHHHHLR
ncbi:Transposon Ty3-G Gag-Pol poly [Paramuricea clavata]|uniref:Transposon Ty3-G Gag-Pol poly n=1 Tax=Paramuricea clavata TaxID=317549 RepID=A0A6S7IBJ0_PARCT|nr:Transposon Ty3-G Gag-Pol poly [Paramuricea clavata]